MDFQSTCKTDFNTQNEIITLQNALKEEKKRNHHRANKVNSYTRRVVG